MDSLYRTLPSDRHGSGYSGSLEPVSCHGYARSSTLTGPPPHAEEFHERPHRSERGTQLRFIVVQRKISFFFRDKVVMDVKREEAEMKDETGLLISKGPEDHGYSEVGESDQRLDERCTAMECEIRSVNGTCNALEARNRSLEAEKCEIESELLDLRRKNAELMQRISQLENERKGDSVKNTGSEVPKFVDLTEAEEDEEDSTFLLMIENKALECEKQKAQRDAELWKGKFEELVLWVSQKDEKVVEDLFRFLDSPELSTRKEIMDLKKKACCGFETNLHRHVRKRLVFGTADGSTGKMAPATPGVSKPVTVDTIDINDSDDDMDDVGMDREDLNPRISETPGSDKGVSSVRTPRRKRVLRIVASDTDSDNDGDDVPISRFKKMRVVGSPNSGDTSSGGKGTHHSRVISTAVEVDEDDDMETTEDAGSDSEGPSLGGFIVSDGDDATNESDGDSESDGETDFEEVISTFRRKREYKYSEWKFEGDMLAAFGKDPELCMRAVCALYRQQTADERVSKGAFYNNRRGFSKFDAPRGSELGDFLTGGDPEGDLKKSVEELQEHDPKAVELCRTLATHYSKQLFEIYQNKEDPLFLPG